MLVLTEKEVASSLSIQDCIVKVEEAYIRYAEGRLPSFFRAGGNLTADGGAFEILPCSHLEKKYFGFKYASSYPTNPQRGFPTVASTILLCDLTTGFPVAHMGANLLTALKTAASPAVATKYLARNDASVVCIIGAGFQARYQLRGLAAVLKIRELRILDLNRDNATAMAKWFNEEVDPATKVIVASEAEQAVSGAEVITTITTSFKPVITAQYLQKGCHINAMGSWLPEMQELDDSVVLAADFVATDIAHDMWHAAGDMIQPLNKGLITKEYPVSELGDIVKGTKKGRENDRQITIFESVGFSSLDISLAIAVYENAQTQGLGTEIPVFA